MELTISLTELEFSILRALCCAGRRMPTGEISLGLPANGNSSHQHSALIRTWLEKLQSAGLVQSHVAYAVTAWELTEIGLKVARLNKPRVMAALTSLLS
jgi:hypothetical protein